MNQSTTQAAVHIKEEQQRERSHWYGPNLVTFLTTKEETNGAFSLLKVQLRKGFEPPLHIHSREEESYVILDGEVQYNAGQQTFTAKSGDYVHLPRLVPHTFRLISDTATLLLFITPGGFEEMFKQCSRPAQVMELPPLTGERPGKEFFEMLKRVNEELGVTFLPNL